MDSGFDADPSVSDAASAELHRGFPQDCTGLPWAGGAAPTFHPSPPSCTLAAFWTRGIHALLISHFPLAHGQPRQQEGGQRRNRLLLCPRAQRPLWTSPSQAWCPRPPLCPLSLALGSCPGPRLSPLPSSTSVSIPSPNPRPLCWAVPSVSCKHSRQTYIHSLITHLHDVLSSH